MLFILFNIFFIFVFSYFHRVIFYVLIFSNIFMFSHIIIFPCIFFHPYDRILTGAGWSLVIDPLTSVPFWYNDDTGEANYARPKIIEER